MSQVKYSKMLSDAKKSVEYWTEFAILGFTEELARLMAEKNVSRTELAKRIGSSQAYITKVLRGNVNFTLATITKLTRALDSVVNIHLSAEDVIVCWYDQHVEDQFASLVFAEEDSVTPELETEDTSILYEPIRRFGTGPFIVAIGHTEQLGKDVTDEWTSITIGAVAEENHDIAAHG